MPAPATSSSPAATQSSAASCGAPLMPLARGALTPRRPCPRSLPPAPQRKYLEKAGVVDALTKVLVGLYEEPERPLHAVDYVKKYIGAPAGVDVDALRAENERLRAEVTSLKEQLHAANAAAGH